MAKSKKKPSKKKATKKKGGKKRASPKKGRPKKASKKKPDYKKGDPRRGSADSTWTSSRGMTFLEIGDTVWMHIPENPEDSVFRYILFKDEGSGKWGAGIWNLSAQAPGVIGIDPTHSTYKSAAKALESIVPSYTRAPTLLEEEGRAIVAANPGSSKLKNKLMR
ncbi:MAG: hypothetical protein KAJ42_12530 [Gemmatimonadetes bacterium]|nr:hypothetical protein [Gemmatimonadota bacterium]